MDPRSTIRSIIVMPPSFVELRKYLHVNRTRAPLDPTATASARVCSSDRAHFPFCLGHFLEHLELGLSSEVRTKLHKRMSELLLGPKTVPCIYSAEQQDTNRSLVTDLIATFVRDGHAHESPFGAVGSLGATACTRDGCPG